MNFNKKLRGFTLVEMLIVIVIIGVLAAALIPRLTSVRARAVDVARTTDVGQIATAIHARASDIGRLPGSTSTVDPVSSISGEILGYLNAIPSDPVDTMTMSEYPGLTGEYGYVKIKKGTSFNQGFVIISRVQTNGAANRVNSGTATTINSGFNVDTLLPCTSVSKAGSPSVTQGGACFFSDEDQLRFISVRRVF